MPWPDSSPSGGRGREGPTLIASPTLTYAIRTVFAQLVEFAP
jgi:hypothetical protein